MFGVSILENFQEASLAALFQTYDIHLDCESTFSWGARECKQKIVTHF